MSTAFYQEPSASIPIYASCDILVVGGGAAGHAAALAAARAGAKISFLWSDMAIWAVMPLAAMLLWFPISVGMTRPLSEAFRRNGLPVWSIFPVR